MCSGRTRGQCGRLWDEKVTIIHRAAVLSAIPALAVSALIIAPALIVAAQKSPGAPPRTPTVAERCLPLQVFLRSDSTLCQEALQYAESLTERREGICLEVVDTLENQQALDRYWRLVRQFGVKEPRVPLFYACGRLKVGFSNEGKSAAAIEDLFAIHAYIRPSCRHCRDAQQFLMQLATRWHAVRVVFHEVDRAPDAAQEMAALARQHGIMAPSLPTIYVCGRVISGYHTDATTGRQIEEELLKASVADERSKRVGPPPEHRDGDSIQKLRAVVRENDVLVPSIGGATTVSYAGEPDAAENSLPPAELPPDLPPLAEKDEASEETYGVPVEAPEGVELPWIGYVRVRDWGLPTFTLLIGLIDGFNPCAMWVLVFLLSVLVNIQDRRKIAAIAGTFVVVSGLAYFAFMAAWLNLFMLVGIARPLQVALGVLAVVIGLINVKDFFAFKQGVTLSIPESAKPGIYGRVRRIVSTDYISVAVGLSVMLAVVVNVVELMCTAGLPAVYTQILTLQQLPAWKNYAYLGLYNLGYIFDDSLMVIAFVITLSHRKMRVAEGRWLKLLSGIVVLALGLAMLFRPDWLQW
jgi:hypothetical protein